LAKGKQAPGTAIISFPTRLTNNLLCLLLAVVVVLLLLLLRILEVTMVLGNDQQVTGTAPQVTSVGPLPLVYAADIAATGNRTDAALCAPNSLNASALTGPAIVVSRPVTIQPLATRAGVAQPTRVQPLSTWLLVTPIPQHTVLE
jgi:hypothetical protein